MIQSIYYNKQTGEKINIFPDFLLATSGMYIDSNFSQLKDKEELFYFKGGAGEQAKFVQNLVDEGFELITVERKIGN